MRAITVAPPHWQDLPTGRTRRAFAHHTKGAFFILDGARDTAASQGGSFFPENLRAELHPIRATMEAYSKTAEIDGRAEADANGVAYMQQHARDLTVRVYHEDFVTTYVIDRWE